MSGRLRLTLLGALALSACVSPGRYGGDHYSHPEAESQPAPTQGMLLSAHLGRYGETPAPTQARILEGEEPQHDRITLVFAVEIDPLSMDPYVFGILRADGRRVRPAGAFLAPADEGDENRSVTLIGNFGEPSGADEPGTPPVAVHIIGNLYAETGENLRGLDANIIGPDEPDRPVFAERLASDPSRCAGARQVVRTYWTDSLRSVGVEDLAGISLRLADGRTLTPSDFDDQAQRSEDPPCEPMPHVTACPGPVDDNVLDLCVDADAAVVHLRFAAGLFEDEAGHPSASAELTL